MRTGSFSRYNVVGGALSLAGLFIFVWMIQIQLSPNAQDIIDQGKAYTWERKTLYPERGNIYDRWGHLLAGSTEVYEVGVNLTEMTDPDTISMTLASILEMDQQTIHGLLTMKNEDGSARMYTPVSNSVSSEDLEEIENVMKRFEEQADRVDPKKRKDMPNMNGVTWAPHLQRSYPENSLGSSIIGFYSYRDRENGQGYFGVEAQYDHLLAGQPVKVTVPRDPYQISELPYVAPGSSLVLTIDREIQSMTEEVLDKAVADNDAQSGVIIIMDPRNGELLAMASTPRLNPNEYWKYGEMFPSGTPFNRAVEATYEPGSVFKVLTMAAALDSGTVDPSTVFLDTGAIDVGGITIRNWDRGAWGPQDMTGCMQHSLNVCLAWIATEMGPSTFYRYLQEFGIGHLTGIDISGEANWPLSVQGDENWYPVNLGTNSFGQGLAVTPVQMVTAISAVANNQGKMMAPHVLKAVISDGKEYPNSPQVIGTPISAETARTLTEMLSFSLEEESSIALVEGYRVAGKTGTAEIGGPEGYNTSLTNASFVGWGPVDDPRFIVYVWLEKPTSSPWGSVVAAPVFSEVASKLVVLLDLPPDAIRQELAANQ